MTSFYAGQNMTMDGFTWRARGEGGPGRGYESARKHRLIRERSTAGGRHEAHLTEKTLWDLREIARDLRRNNTLFRGVLRTIVRNVMGPVGFTLKGDDRLVSWWEDLAKTKELDRRKRQQFWPLVKTSFYGQVLDSDFFWVVTGGKIAPIPGDRVVTPAKSPDTIVHGIAVNRDGVPQRYFFTDARPSRSGVSGIGPQVTEDKGRWVDASNVLHWACWEEEPADATRPEPIGGVLSAAFDKLDSFVQSALIAARVQADNPLFVQKDEDPDVYAQLLANQNPDEQEADSPPIESAEPGTVTYLRTKEKVVAVGSTQPNPNVPQFVQLICRILGAATGLPLELILLDFSLGNFSAARLAVEEAKKTFRCQQQGVIDNVDQFFVAIAEAAVARKVFGELTPAEAKQLLSHRWIAPGWPYVQPLEDIKADSAAVQLGTKSRQEICATRGRDWWDVLEEIEEEQAALEQAGIPVSFGSTSGQRGRGANQPGEIVGAEDE